MPEAVAEAHALEGFFGLFFVRDAVKILRKHYVFERGQIRHQMELLKNEAYFFRAVTDQIVFAEFREIHPVYDHVS